MRMLRAASLAVLTLLFAGDGGRHLAGATCYKIAGCSERDAYNERDLAGRSCAALAEMRRAIYAENGYCLGKAPWRGTFSGRNCRYADVASVPLSGIEQGNARAIQRAERTKGCHGA